MQDTVATAEQEDGGAYVVVGVEYVRAKLACFEGRFEEARAHNREAERVLAEHGLGLMHAAHGLTAAETELAAETYDNAIVLLRRAYDALLAIGDRGFRSTATAYLAQALYGSGKRDEAEAAALETEELSGRTDLMNFAMGRGVRARIEADRGELDRAEELARSAVGYAFETDFPEIRGDAMFALAHVLRAFERADEALEAVQHAQAIYEAKGDRVSADRARALVAELGGG
jgi:tetratricopeptide (TPR) repeat protein